MNIFNDFELLDFCNLDVMMWGEDGGQEGDRFAMGKQTARRNRTKR